MSRAHDVNENLAYDTDSGVSLDDEGYLLAPGADPESVKLMAVGDPYVGVNHSSSAFANFQDDTALDDQPDSVIQDGTAMMLCASGTNYTFGDAVYISSTNGVADASSTGNKQVGMVAHDTDLSGASEPGHVPVLVTGFVGQA